MLTNFTKDQREAVDLMKKAIKMLEATGVTLMCDPDGGDLLALDENDQYIGDVTSWGDAPESDDDLYEVEDTDWWFSSHSEKVGSCWMKPDKDCTTLWVGDHSDDEG